MENLVTIAIPFYNDSKHLESAILSVINQSYKDWKLILVDDGSSDGSLEIAQKFASDNRITIISDGLNKGLPARLNEISSIVDTEYYARMDADDIMDVDRIRTELDFLQHHPDIDVLGSLAYVIDDYNNIIGKTGVNNTTPTSMNDILNGGAFIHPTIMGKTIWFQTHPYDERLRRMQDLALWLTTVECSKFKILQDYLLYYRTGKFTVKKYFKTQKYSRRFFTSFLLRKEKKVGLFFKLYIKSLIKTVIYYLLSLFYNVEIVIRKRYLPVNSIEEQRIDRKLASALIK